MYGSQLPFPLKDLIERAEVIAIGLKTYVKLFAKGIPPGKSDLERIQDFQFL